jgi:hypothetical protein
MRLRAYLSLVVLGLLLAWAGTAHALWPHERGRWMVGVSLGPGSSDLRLVDPNADPSGYQPYVDTDWIAGRSAQMRFGWVFVPDRLMLSVEGRQWLDEQGIPFEEDGEPLKVRSNVQQYSLALTYFPGRVDGPTGGIYLKAGAGWANGRFTVLRDATEEEKEASGGNEFTELYKNDDGGLALFGEIGYEIFVWKTLGAGLAASYSFLDLDGTVYLQAQTVALALSLNWYW